MDLQQTAYVVGIMAVLFPFIRWAYRWTVRIDTACTNHIPHMERALKALCKINGIIYSDLEDED